MSCFGDSQVSGWRLLASVGFCVWVCGALSGCYEPHGAKLFNATSFPVHVRIWKAEWACDGPLPASQAWELRECLELPAGIDTVLPSSYDGDACEVAVVEGDGLATTLLSWDRDLVLGGEGRARSDANTVYLERVGERLYLTSAPNISAETYLGELPLASRAAAECPR
ncbi:MAG: hypothetical protein H6718_21030 [Polyangiaceae bacterium]|nr:hypothetical protein [Myxococcales bacterium]MCB9587902.1 hypothetical protein [Polyangiaceae bacterium]